MNTFRWTWWRFAWLAFPVGWDSMTVYDHNGEWRNVIGRLCYLKERAEDLYY